MSRTRRKLPANKFMRRPKTLQELRENEGALKDGVPVRKKRCKKHLPTAWDDKVIAALYEKID